MVDTVRSAVKGMNSFELKDILGLTGLEENIVEESL